MRRRVTLTPRPHSPLSAHPRLHPTLQRYMESAAELREGAARPLSAPSLVPPFSHPLWGKFASGADAARRGVSGGAMTKKKEAVDATRARLPRLNRGSPSFSMALLACGRFYGIIHSVR